MNPLAAIWIPVFVLLLTFTAGLIIIAVKNRKKRKPDISTHTPYNNTNRQSICFLGGFRAFDKQGKRITDKFSPTLRRLFVLIALYSASGKRGISSIRIQQLLWPDKSNEAARNNRSVNLSKLRLLLEEIEGIDVVNNEGYWAIAVSDEAFIDYYEALHLINRLQGNEMIDMDDLTRLLELLNQGAFLPNIQFDWVDDFKTEFSNNAIDLLLQLINDPATAHPDRANLQLKTANAIITMDTLNEEAIALKCRTLYEKGKTGLAKSAFDAFAKEYRASMGEPYRGTFKSIIEPNRL